MSWKINKETLISDWNDVFFGAGSHSGFTNQPNRNSAKLAPHQLALDKENQSFKLKNSHYLIILKTSKGFIITKNLNDVVPNWVTLEQIGLKTILTSKTQTNETVQSEIRVLDSSTFNFGDLSDFKLLYSTKQYDETSFGVKSKNLSYRATFKECWDLSIGVFVNQLRKKWNNTHYVLKNNVKHGVVESYQIELMNYNKYLSTVKSLTYDNREFLDREFLPKKITGSRLKNLIELYDLYVAQGILENKNLSIDNLNILGKTPELWKNPLNGWLSLFDLNLPITSGLYVDFGNAMENTILEQARWHHKLSNKNSQITGISAADVNYDYFSKNNKYLPKDSKFSTFVGGVPDGIITLNGINYLLEIKTALSCDYKNSIQKVEPNRFVRNFPLKSDFKKILYGLDPKQPKSMFNRLSNYKPENILQSVLYGYLLDSKGISLDIFMVNPDYYSKVDELKSELQKQISSGFKEHSPRFFNFEDSFINSVWQFEKLNEKTNKMELTELGVLQQNLILILRELITIFDDNKFLVSPVEMLTSSSPFYTNSRIKTYEYLLCQNQHEYESWLLNHDKPTLEWVKTS